MSDVIPEKHVEFAKKIAALCKEMKLNRFSASFQPGFGDDWHHEIQLRWDSGRHGVDNRKLFLSSTVMVHTEISDKDEG